MPTVRFAPLDAEAARDLAVHLLAAGQAAAEGSGGQEGSGGTGGPA